MTVAASPPVILFVFAGRQFNLELQLPIVRRILDENPNVVYHVWNFARNDSDREYIKTISGPQIKVFNGEGDGFDSPNPTGEGRQFGASEHNAAYKAYADSKFKDHLFIKIDDDIVFLETARFPKFVEAIDEYRGSVLIANIVNNGACTPVQPEIWKKFQKLKIPLLDIHMSNKFADMVHTYFCEHPDEFLNQPLELVPTQDWTSINAVGYDHPTLCHVIRTIGKPQPEYLAGRPMHGWGRVFGDEGVFQILPRFIVKGFTAAHLTFGPQKPSDRQLETWLNNYRELGETYLESAVKDPSVGLPEPSEPSCGYVGPRPKESGSYFASQWGENNWRTRLLAANDPWRAPEDNDPRAGRYTP